MLALSQSVGNIAIIIMCINLCSGEMLQKNADNYGPFVVQWNDYSLCHGPKSKNLTTLTTKLQVKDNSYSGLMNFSFPTTVGIDEIKIVVYTIKGNRRNLLWNYKVDQPCQHYAIASILANQLDAKNCVVKKGDYYCEVNFTESTLAFLGTSFFYGEFVFKLIVLSKKGNIACLLFTPVFIKKV